MGVLRKLRKSGSIPVVGKPNKPKDRSLKRFFEQVAGRPLPAAEARGWVSELVLVEKELDKPRNSLSRLREVWNEFVELGGPKIAHRPMMAEEIRRIRLFGELKPTDRITSIGSGTAMTEAYIAKSLVPNGKVTCVDISPKMNKLAEQTKARAGVQNMGILTRSGTETGLPSASQDKVLAIRTYLPKTIHWQPILKEVRRIIKNTPDARFILAFRATSPGDVPKVVDSLRRSGFNPGQPVKYGEHENLKVIMIISKPA